MAADEKGARVRRMTVPPNRDEVCDAAVERARQVLGAWNAEPVNQAILDQASRPMARDVLALAARLSELEALLEYIATAEDFVDVEDVQAYVRAAFGSNR